MATTTGRARAAGKTAAKADKTETVQQLKNRLRNEAEREVLDLHKKEVITRTAAKYKEHGLEYVRRLTDEEKAQKAIEEHLAKYPNLRQQFLPPEASEVAAEIVAGGGEFGYRPISERPGTYAEFDASEYADVEAREGE